MRPRTQSTWGLTLLSGISYLTSSPVIHGNKKTLTRLEKAKVGK